MVLQKNKLPSGMGWILNNMKSFITKKIGKYELCLVSGWVGNDHKVLFFRDKKNNVLYDYGMLPNDQANKMFDTIVELLHESRKGL